MIAGYMRSCSTKFRIKRFPVAVTHASSGKGYQPGQDIGFSSLMSVPPPAAPD
jgi:hypothetical protein